MIRAIFIFWVLLGLMVAPAFSQPGPGAREGQFPMQPQGGAAPGAPPQG